MVNKNEFNSKTVLITGASSGIGAAFAKNLARKNADLILVARTEEKLLTLKKELEIKYGVSVHVVVDDLSKIEAPQRICKEVFSKNIKVDLLINNAGIGKQGPFEQLSLKDYEEAIQVNICSTIALTRLIIPHMLERGRGGVINVSSTAAFQPLPYFAIYSASKSFILYFSEALWGEYAHRGINILAVCPGHTKTNFHKKAGVPDYRLFNVALSDDVVELALKAYCKGKPTVITGRLNHFLSVLPRMIPRRLVINIMRNFFKPKEEYVN